MILLEGCLNCESHSQKKSIQNITFVFLERGQTNRVHLFFFFAFLVFVLFMVHADGVVHIRT